MSTAKKGLLPRIEILIVLVFFLSFIIWAASKCNTTKQLYAEEDQREAATAVDTLSDTSAEISGDKTSETSAAPGTTGIPQTGTPSNQTADKSTGVGGVSSAGIPSAGKSTSLFVTIDGLNLRTEPRLNAEVVAKLKLNDEVFFMNEVTDTTQQINLGKVIADEPWVKVKNNKGKIGWVYGAGVHYYKLKHPGTIE